MWSYTSLTLLLLQRCFLCPSDVDLLRGGDDVDVSLHPLKT